MNRNILQKCIDELKEPVSPRLDYVRGMLETLLEMMPESVSSPIFANHGPGVRTMTPVPEPTEVDERAVMDAKARAAIAAVKSITEESTDA